MVNIRYPQHGRNGLNRNLEFILKKTVNGFYLIRIIETHLRFSRLIENLYAVFSDETINIAGI